MKECWVRATLPVLSQHYRSQGDTASSVRMRHNLPSPPRPTPRDHASGLQWEEAERRGGTDRSPGVQVPTPSGRGGFISPQSQAVARAGLASAPVPALCPAFPESSSSCGDAAGRRRCAEGGVCERTLVCVWVCVQVQRGPVRASGARIRAGVVHPADSGLGVEPWPAGLVGGAPPPPQPPKDLPGPLGSSPPPPAALGERPTSPTTWVF